MNFSYLASFDKSLKGLPHSQIDKIEKAIEKFITFFEAHEQPKGLGIKKLRYDFWELRVGLEYRVIFILRGKDIYFVFAGTHDDIKRFIKNL